MTDYYGTPASEIIDPLDTSDDYIFADEGDDVVYGWYGNDFLVGWGGNDILYGEEGDDTLWAGNGTDLLYGGNGNDELAGWNGNDELYGGNGDDYLLGEYGNDYLYGGIGNDILDGGTNDYPGGDQMYGGAGDDIYYVDSHDEFYIDNVYENADEGIDTVFSSAYYSGLDENVENITLIGDAYGANGNNLDNTMTGNSSDNYLWGDYGSDSLSGGEGNDVLNGYGYGSSNEYDILTGGGGADTFEIGSVFDASYLNNDYALITDFNYSEGDKFEAHGGISDYSLETFNWFGSDALDTGIYYQGDLIAVAQDRSGWDIVLEYDFNFVVV
jgi:Ca2+-binding RTX toxin-like protein